MTEPATDRREVARSTRAAVKAGGRFMTSLELKAVAKPLGMGRSMLYLRGRVGAVGEVSPAVATAVYGMFPDWLIDTTWDQTAALSAADAAAAFGGAGSEWGRTQLGRLGDPERLVGLAERVVDGVDASALVLFAAWRARARTVDALARAAHAVNLLRELRGGLHFAALRAEGVDVPLAVIVDPEAGAEQMRKTGWTDSEIAAVQERADRMPDLLGRWTAAEERTGDAFALTWSVLDDGECGELATDLIDFEQVSRPAVD